MAAGKRGSCSGQRGRRFGGMVAVVIDQCEVAAGGCADLAMPCEAPADAGELAERSNDGCILDAKLGSDGNGGQSVRDVMQTRQVQRDVKLRGAVFTRNAKFHPSAVCASIERANLRVIGKSVGQQRFRHGWQDLAHVRVVDAYDRGSVKRQTREKIDESLLQSREVVPIGFHVVAVDIGDNRDHRIQIEKRRVGLVGFDHDVVPTAQPRIRAQQN